VIVSPYNIRHPTNDSQWNYFMTGPEMDVGSEYRKDYRSQKLDAV
jgi:hypothetical protein